MGSSCRDPPADRVYKEGGETQAENLCISTGDLRKFRIQYCRCFQQRHGLGRWSKKEREPRKVDEESPEGVSVDLSSLSPTTADWVLQWIWWFRLGWIPKLNLFQNHVAGLLQGSYLSDSQSEAKPKFDKWSYGIGTHTWWVTCLRNRWLAICSFKLTKPFSISKLITLLKF